MGRLLASRTSLLWVIGLGILGVVTALSGLRTGSALADQGIANSYYVVAHFHYTLTIGVAFAIFAAIYLGLEIARRGPHRRLLGGVHFALSFAGAVVTLAPVLLVPVLGVRILVPPLESFRFLNGIAGFGYLLMLSGLAVFVAVLADSFRRAPNPG